MTVPDALRHLMRRPEILLVLNRGLNIPPATAKECAWRHSRVMDPVALSDTARNVLIAIRLQKLALERDFLTVQIVF